MYDFDHEISRLHTYSTKWDYIADRFSRNDIIPYSISDTDFMTSNEIIAQLQHRVAHGIFGYSRWNHDDFKQSIVNWFASRFFVTMQKEWICYSPSVIYAISILIQLKSAPQEKVLVLSPMYDAFFNVVKENQRQLVQHTLQYNSTQQHFEINWTQLETQLADPLTRIFLLTNPHNPTGRVWRRDELARLYQLCQQHHVFLISDDIHMDIVYQDHQYIPITQMGLDDVCLITSNSKSFNVPSLGGAYLFIPDEALQQQFLMTLKGRDGLSSPSILGITALMTGYNESANYIDEQLAYLTRNRQIIIDYVRQYLPLVDFTPPEGTYLAWLNVTKLNCSVERLQQALVYMGKVGIMSGQSYGDDNYLRLNFACTQRHLRYGLEGLRKAIESLA